MSKITTLLLAVAGSILTLQAATPSFDCKKASGEAEHLICRDSGLATLDHKMANTYAKARNRFLGNEMNRLVSQQRSWIKRRNHCKRSKPCIVRAYQERITQIQVEGGLLPNSGSDRVTYRCDNGRSVNVVYYNNTEIPSLYLDTGRLQKLLFRTESGSGVKYRSGNALFWEHHGEATVNIGKSESVCREQK